MVLLSIAIILFQGAIYDAKKNKYSIFDSSAFRASDFMLGQL
jgi:hypothetical protein